MRSSRLDWTPLVIGTAAALGIHLYGLIDADDAARRANARRLGATARPLVRPVLAAHRRGGAHVGIEVALGR